MDNKLLLAINSDLNSLYHSGRLGMKKGVFGASGATRWQSQAVYAKGMNNPNAEEKTKKSIKEKVGDALATTRAKNDAAITVINRNPSKGNTKGARRIALQQNVVAGGAGLAAGAAGIAAGGALGRTIGTKIGSKAIGNMSGEQLSRLTLPTAKSFRSAGRYVDGHFTNQVTKLTDFAKNGQISPTAKELFRNAARPSYVGRISNVGNVVGSSVVGGVASSVAASAARTAHYNSLVKGYTKRRSGDYGKMTDSQIKKYKDVYQEYLKIYNQETKINYKPYTPFLDGKFRF